MSRWRALWKCVLATAVAIGLVAVVAACGGATAVDGEGGESSLPTSDGEPVAEIRAVGPNPAYDAGQNEAMQIVVEGLEELGLRVSFDGVADFGTFAEVASQGNFDVAAAGYIGTLPRMDPSLLMSTPFLCDAGDDSNYSGYCNEEYDRVFTESLHALDEADRVELVHQGQQIIAEDLPQVVLYHPISAAIINSSRIDGAEFSPAGGYFNFWSFTQGAPQNPNQPLVAGFAERGSSMNPTCNSGGYFQEQEYQTLIFDTLTRVRPDGEAIPWAAEEIEQTGNEVHITLRPGMTFHNGRDVTAEDVAFSLQYLADWEVGQYLETTGRIESIDVNGDLELTLNMTEAYSPLMSSLAQIPILPKNIWESVENPCDWANPSFVGSGPFKVQSYSPNQDLRLLRHDDYFEPAAAAAFVGRRYASTQSLFLDLMAGNVDIASSDPSFTTTQVEEAKQNGDLTVTEEPSITLRWMGFNVREGTPFADPALRRAAAHTIDFDLITTGVLQGRGEPGSGPIAPANTRWHDSSIEWPRRDLAKAQEILAEAGYGIGDDGVLRMPEAGDTE